MSKPVYYTIRAAVRDNFKGYWSAGRHWSDNQDSVVEVTDAEDDPLDETGKIFKLKIGQRSLKHMKAEPGYLFIKEGGIPAAPVMPPQDRIAQLEHQVRELTTQLQALVRPAGKATPSKTAE